jgi:hypothetical protein
MFDLPPAKAQRTYTDEQMLDGLRRYARETSATEIAMRDYDAWRRKQSDRFASSQAITERFNGWVEACAKAGTPATKAAPDSFTKSELLEFLLQATADKNANPERRLPSAEVLAKFAAAHPTGRPRITSKSYDRPFGSLAKAWKKLYKAQQRDGAIVEKADGSRILTVIEPEGRIEVRVPANLDWDEIEGNRGVNWTIERMQDALVQYSQEAGPTHLSFKEYDKWAKKRGQDVPRAQSISKHFAPKQERVARRRQLDPNGTRMDGWYEACMSVGCKPNQIPVHRIPPRELVEHLIAAYKDDTANPKRRTPDKKLLRRYGEQHWPWVSHAHYNFFWGTDPRRDGGIAECWKRIREAHAANKDTDAPEIYAGLAEQPDPAGYVYVMGGDGLPGMYKIGLSTDPEARRAAIQTGNPTPIRVFFDCWVPDKFAAEHELHTRFEEKRGQGEWFALDDADLKWIEEWVHRQGGGSSR